MTGQPAGGTRQGAPTPATLDELNAAIDTQLELVDDIKGPYLDLCAQHHSEVSAYGDSWPGAQLQIAAAAAALTAAQHALWDLIDERNTRYPFHGPIYIPAEEPF